MATTLFFRSFMKQEQNSLHHCGYTELDFGGVGTIMSDVAIEYKDQIYYGDEILLQLLWVRSQKLHSIFFINLRKDLPMANSLPWHLQKHGWFVMIMIKKKVAAIPEEAIKKITNQ